MTVRMLVTLLFTLATLPACAPALYFEVSGVVVTPSGRAIPELTVSCKVLSEADDIDKLEDVDFTHTVTTTTSVSGSYTCGDVPSELLAPNPWPGVEYRDLALAFVDVDGDANEGTFTRLEQLVLRVASGATRTVDVTLAPR